MTGKLTFRRYDSAYSESMFELYDDVYGAEKARLWRNRWTWEFGENPHRPGKEAVWMAEEGGRVVGLTSAIPVVARWRGETVRVSWLIDLMTHSGWRGRGIFRKLTELMIEETGRDGISLFFCFPNDQSGPLLRRRGWPDVTTIPGMIRSLRLMPLLKNVQLRSIPRILAGAPIVARQIMGRPTVPAGAERKTAVAVREAHSFDERFDGLFEEASKACDFIVQRDSRYLDWRYLKCPDRAYTILLAEERGDLSGYIVIAAGRPGGKGCIVDFLTRPGVRQHETIGLLANHGVSRLRKMGAVSVELCSLGEPYDSVLQSQGFSLMPDSAFRGYRMVGYRVDGSASGLDFTDIRRWFITRGDADSDIAADL